MGAESQVTTGPPLNRSRSVLHSAARAHCCRTPATSISALDSAAVSGGGGASAGRSFHPPPSGDTPPPISSPRPPVTTTEHPQKARC